MKRAVFLDRDGTLIEEVGFLRRIEDLRLFDFTKQALSILKEQGFLLIVVTNQSGINRGFFSQSDMEQIHLEIQKRLEGMIDAFYFCPHLPEENCFCRKPSLGMIEKASKDFSIDIGKSWTIGDKIIDLELGIKAGTKTALVLTGYGSLELHRLRIKPDLVGANIFEVAKKIVYS
ncbi:MAG: HAD family hydrolase [Pyrinomonadaceae bacterium]|nr:HAD family hydrolase [Pyrinomonadaceae bacterium]MCX7639155.1 HAD family hydrolase [Pyrinomonadaceae bacterium]MDW8303624.1 HAD family hydrolase [Acidobacteriota bacterium]